MGSRYVVEVRNVTPTAGNDALTLVSASGRRIRLVSISATGRGSTSAAQGVEVARATTAGITGGGGITPTPVEHSDQPAAAVSAFTTWATQPVVPANGWPLGWNAIGGQSVWNVPKDAKYEARNGENLSVRVPTGYTMQACSIAVMVEED